MSIEKILVEEFEFLDNNGELGIALQLEEAPVETGKLVYDGRNCAILIRNGVKAYLLTNLIPEIRQKLMRANEIMIIEQKEEEILNSYMVDIVKVDNIPYEDTLTETLQELFNDLTNIYGVEGLDRIVKGIQNKE